MAPDAVTAQRLYQRLRREIISGAYPPGALLVTSRLAAQLGTSVSPLRDAMHRLIGERLLERQEGGGFALPHLDRAQVRHLYAWQVDLLQIVARSALVLAAPDLRQVAAVIHQDALADLPSATAQLFEAMAQLTGNGEHEAAMAALNARMHALRRAELTLGRCRAELRSLAAHLASLDRRRVRIALWTYHRRRLSSVEQILAATARA